VAELGTVGGFSNSHHLRVTIAQSPQQSVFLALREAVSCRGPFSARPVLRSLPNVVARPAYARALRPLRRDGQHGALPDAVVPLAASHDTPVTQQVEALHEFSGQALLDDIDTLGPCAQPWRQAVGDPDRWLRTYAELTRVTWHALERRWHALRPVFDAEVERLGIAIVRGCLPDVLNTLSPRLRFTETGYGVDGQPMRSFDGRSLVLVPSIGAADTLFIQNDDPELVTVAYPLRDLPDTDPVQPAEDPLEVVLGVPRAHILRLLAIPLNVGTIAAELRVTPAAATRHCDVLVRAGLITRERHGREVRVTRTTRGTHLLDLL
jgi:DNA-binding transcriptional ArsR family regulator